MSAVKKFVPDDQWNKMAAEWMQLSETISNAKARELELRNSMIKAVYPKLIPEGTNNIPLPEGWVFKVVGKTNLKVNEDAIGATRELIKEGVEAGDIEPFSLDQAIKFKPELSATGLKALTPEQQKYVLNCVEAKPGQATIEITKPKRAIQA